MVRVATRKLDKGRAEADDLGVESSSIDRSPAVDRSPVVDRGPVIEPGAVVHRGAVVTFEQAIARLGEIVDSLEEGEQPLEESIALFEEGMTLAKSSQEILDRAERRIEELLGVDAQGKPVVREIEPD
jgi:exodeoxyribonuclease VII small subunit